VFSGGTVATLALTPKSFGCDDLDPAGLAGGDAAHNAQVIRNVLAGDLIGHGEPHEAFVTAAAMTAALGLAVLDPSDQVDIASRLPAEFVRTRATLSDGSAAQVVERWREASQA
jgi:anthranilate phosphoribosyltransferase